jgi:hypothetical protein
MVTDSDSTENQQDDASAASVDDSANKKHQSLIYLENGKSRAKKTRKKTFSKNTFSKTTTRMIPVRPKRRTRRKHGQNIRDNPNMTKRRKVVAGLISKISSSLVMILMKPT